ELVQRLRRRLIFEALGSEDVTPVAGGISDAEVNGLAFLQCTREGLFAPRIPVDGVVRVLAQVRAGLGFQPVGVFRAAVRIEVQGLHAAWKNTPIVDSVYCPPPNCPSNPP